ncbi:MAG: MmgE/PrpD family protein [Paracoccaceae bacterium]
MTITRDLCQFAASKLNPEPALAMMRLSLLDWSVCALAGSREPAAQIVRDMVLAEGGAPEATLIGQSARVPARAAALVNGVASHALDYDDTHFAHIGHPSVAVIPAALAVAERTGASGAKFLQAALIGAEASIRLGVWLGRAHYQFGFHQTATAGAFGAALAAARLLGLDKDQMAHALGLVSSRASGLKSQFGTMGKPMNAGIAAVNGVEAALLAGAGFISNPQALEGAQGFGKTHAAVCDSAAFEGLGKIWLFENISHKFHACCHGLHAMLEAVGQVRGGFDAAQVAKISIIAHPRWDSVCNIAAPSTALETKFSFRLTAAMAIRGIDMAAPASYSEATARDTTLIAMRDLVEVEFDSDIAETAARVVITLADGSIRQGAHDLADPLPFVRRKEKLKAKAAALVGQRRAQLLWTAIGAGPDMPALLDALKT